LVESIVGAEEPGRVLRRVILDAIQDMKPPPDSPHDTVAAARYQFLYLRYVKGLSIDDMARQLALSERQLYRRQRDALDRVTAVIARKLRLPAPSDEGQPDPARDVECPGRAESIEPEVARIGNARVGAPVDLGLVIQGAVSTVSHLSQNNHRSMSLSVASDRLLVRADRVAVRQAILGLLMFALDSCPGGHIAIAAQQSGSGAEVVVRFPLAGTPDAASLVGRSSNLAVCQRLTELQGGSVDWRVEGTDLVATARMPMVIPRSVLVVDDNPDTLDLFRRYLEAHAYRVLTAATGEEALRIAAEQRPDALVLDVMLPAADGYEALQSLRGDPATADVPVVVCTVLEQRDLALALGATEFLAKPVTQGDLLSVLERCRSR
jgi:CheY-like chemotaxis protein